MKIIYWSGTGNTEKMANLIGKGLKEEGKSFEIISVDEFSGDINDEDTLILGCPAMGSEVLEEDEFQPFIDNIKAQLEGKKIALFGSYGWGDGEWMRNWEEEMNSAGANVVVTSLTVQNEPEGETAEECKQFGRKIAKV